MKLGRQIITKRIAPAIPTKAFDWCAYYDGEGAGDFYGWGKTEADAIDDLTSFHSLMTDTDDDDEVDDNLCLAPEAYIVETKPMRPEFKALYDGMVKAMVDKDFQTFEWYLVGAYGRRVSTPSFQDIVIGEDMDDISLVATDMAYSFACVAVDRDDNMVKVATVPLDLCVYGGDTVTIRGLKIAIV